MKCLCHSGKTYEDCCKPYHDGALLETPLLLMRSRYCAYALGLSNYIIDTTHPSQNVNKAEVDSFCQNTRFEGLNILESTDTTVTFKAILSQMGRNISFIEKSQFTKENGKWFYVSGCVN